MMPYRWREWPDHDNWPEEQIDLFERAHGSMLSGDLSDLAVYIRAGYPIGGYPAEMLADAIEGKGQFKINVKNAGPGKRRVSAAHRRHGEDLKIGALAHVRLEAAARAQAANIKHEVAVAFGVKDSRVREALTYFRKQLDVASARGLAQYDPIGTAQALGAAMRGDLPEK